MRYQSTKPKKNILMLLKDNLLRIIKSQRENLVSHPPGIIRKDLQNH